MDPKQKFFLFKQSRNFCAVPWNHFKVEMDGTVKTCVHGMDTLGNLSTDNIDSILHSPVVKDIRQTLYQDKPHKNCTHCTRHEDESDHKYLRDLYNPMFKFEDIDYSDDSAFQLRAVDLHWSSTCNLKCITCWANQSSSIAQEQGKPVLHTPNDQADKIIDIIVDNQHNLKEIYLSGGEPTLIKHNKRLLKRLDKNIDCQFRINTNMMFEQDNAIINEILKFKNVLFTISADSTADRFNYIRRGADWQKFLTNLTWLQQSHAKFRLNSVFFIASALYLTDTQKFFHNNFGITDFTINQVLMDHTVIKCRNLSHSLKEDCKTKILAHKQEFADNANLCNELDACLQELNCDKADDYTSFFTQFPGNWQEVFPEL
jgi:sulfatase maturation enzyme AslB (radical SAM superfamily)